MDEKKLMDYIHLYQHDLMNHLQLVKGYAQLQDLAQMNVALSDIIGKYEQERKLIHLHLPEFTLFILFITKHYENIDIALHIDVERAKVALYDNEIYKQTKGMMDYFSEVQKEMMYYWLLEIKYDTIKEETKFIFSIEKEKTSHLHDQKQRLQTLPFQIAISEEGKDRKYAFVIPNDR